MSRIWMVVAALLVAGCAGTSGADEPTGGGAEVFEIVDARELTPPSDEVVLEIVVDGAPSQWSPADLEGVDLVRLPLFEPFVKAPTVFEGVRLSELFATIGVDPGDDATIDMVALDEYVYSLPVEEALGSDGVLATRERGEVIPIEAGGPVRLVFRDGSDLSASGRLDAWVWSLARIDAG